MENLIFSLNATLPIFLTMMLGWFFRRIGLMDEQFVSRMNKFVFQAALPVLVFTDLSSVDFFEVWDTKFVLFCFLATVISITAVTLVSFLLKDRSIQGEFIQAAYRSSAAILGIAFIQNIYGNAGMAPLMIVATVPLYNIMAVVVLSVFRNTSSSLRQDVHGGAGSLAGDSAKEDGSKKSLMKDTLKGIVTNPIILGILIGMAWSLLKLPMPPIFQKTLKNVSVLASPLGLMAMGAAFEMKQAGTKLKPVILASFIKLVFLAAVFLPIAVSLGFREEKLIAILVMLGSATTVSCYIMARNMGHEGTLTSSTVMLTTLFSAFTLTGWLYLLRSLGMI